MVVSLLDWDSNFFKRAVTKVDIGETEQVDIAKITADCKSKNCELLYLFIDSRNGIMETEAEKLLGTAINEKVVFEKNTSFGEIGKTSTDKYTFAHIVDSATGQPFYNKLTELAIKAGTFSRFWLDKKLNNEYFFDLYRIWIKNLIDDENCHIILANSSEGEVAGFVSYKKIKEGYKIEFISVDERYQKTGIGRMLLQKMYEQINFKQTGYITVESHAANTTAINFYTSQGFKVKEAFKIYHIHL